MSNGNDSDLAVQPKLTATPVRPVPTHTVSAKRGEKVNIKPGDPIPCGADILANPQLWSYLAKDIENKAKVVTQLRKDAEKLERMLDIAIPAPTGKEANSYEIECARYELREKYAIHKIYDRIVMLESSMNNERVVNKFVSGLTPKEREELAKIALDKNYKVKDPKVRQSLYSSMIVFEIGVRSGLY